MQEAHTSALYCTPSAPHLTLGKHEKDKEQYVCSHGSYRNSLMLAPARGTSMRPPAGGRAAELPRQLITVHSRKGAKVLNFRWWRHYSVLQCASVTAGSRVCCLMFVIRAVVRQR